MGGQELNLLDMTVLDADILFLQEISRDEAGWSTSETEYFHCVCHRDPKMWRSVGVAVSADKLDCIIEKKALRRGI